MSAQHTQGRLVVKANGDANSYALLDERGNWFMSVLLNGEQLTATQEANLRRLAACWNACRGFDTNLLINIDMMGDTLKQRFEGMQAEVRRVDAQLGKRPCQNNRCTELAAARALLAEALAADDEAIADAKSIGLGLPAELTTLTERIRAFLKGGA